ncbi:MAG: hypothetical protein ACKODX_12225 [Gemmata sp.]|jgi:hypothetical protein
MPPHRLAACVLVLLSLIAAGCGDKFGGRVAVSGTVKLAGKPLKDGSVSFEPLDGQASRASAAVTGGAFDIPQANGLQPGKYLIRVSAGDGRTPVNPVDADNPPGPTGGTNIISKELIPADWNVNSKQERSITAGAPAKFDFEIP